MAQALALNYLGNIYFKNGDYPNANMTFSTALAASATDGSPVLVEALTNLATVQLFQENYDVALIGFEEGLRIYEKNMQYSKCRYSSFPNATFCEIRVFLKK